AARPARPPVDGRRRRRASTPRRSGSPGHRFERAGRGPRPSWCPREVEMIDRTEARGRARRQERVAKVVWGSLFLVMGVLFTLHDMGRIDLGEPESHFSAAYAVDGDDHTRWGSAFRDPQWLTVDLGAVTAISKVRIHWEDAYA